MSAAVLIPLDGSELSARILSFLDRLPQRDLRVVLLRVLPEPPVGPTKELVYDEAFRDLYAHESRLRETGLDAVHMLTVGDPADQILRTIAVAQPSLVAMATHGRGGLARTIAGSVAERVLERCPVPLLLGNPSALPVDPGSGFAKILLPLDDSPVSARIVPFVANLAVAHQSEVALLHVGGGGAQLLEPYARRLREEGVEHVSVHDAEGDPAEAIVRKQTELGADLVAISSHSRAKNVTGWFGSVSADVIRGAGCPLLVVRVAAPGS